MDYNNRMQTDSLAEVILITNRDDLTHLAAQLLQEEIIAVDTESNSLYAYQEQVCLIQFSTKKQDFLVDPLLIDDLSPLAPVFANQNIEKVFHAAEYDLIVLKRDFNFKFQNLFDTMLAGRILGWESVGLGAIIKQHFGVTANKRFQRANWGKRPLSAEMVSYARLDTHFLIPLRNMQLESLKSTGRLPIAKEDFQRECNVPITPSKRDINESFWRVAGSKILPPQNAAVLRELCLYRDQVAQRLNRPHFKVFNNKTLYALAETCPTNMETLAKIKGISKHILQKHGRDILNVIKDGLHKEPLYPPKKHRPSDSYLTRLENLRTWRKTAAKRMQVGSDVILPRDLMVAIAEANPASNIELASIMREIPWRLTHFGPDILKALQGVIE